MILVVSLNPALDVTHHVAGVDWSGMNRPRQVTAVPGGKGLNVARTLRALGSDVLVAGLAGGVTGEAVSTGLDEAGVASRFTPVAGETRRTFAVVDLASHDTALFNEPGPAVSAAEYAELLVRDEESLACCGSARPGARRSPSRTSPSWPPRWAGRWRAWPPPRPPLRSCGRRARARWWCRSAVTACSRSPGTGPGARRRRRGWRATPPGRATPWSPGWRRGWCSAGRGRNGCGTRPRSAPPAWRRRPRGSSPPRTTGGPWPGPGSPNGGRPDAGRQHG